MGKVGGLLVLSRQPLTHSLGVQIAEGSWDRGSRAYTGLCPPRDPSPSLPPPLSSHKPSLGLLQEDILGEGGGMFLTSEAGLVVWCVGRGWALVVQPAWRGGWWCGVPGGGGMAV